MCEGGVYMSMSSCGIFILPFCVCLPENAKKLTKVNKMVMRLLVTLALLVVTAHGKSKMDRDFCTAHTKKGSDQGGLEPPLLTNYFYNAESTDLKATAVSYQTFYFAWNDRMVQAIFRRQSETEFEYVFPKTDTYETRKISMKDGKSKCTDEPLQGSEIAKRLNIAPDPNSGKLYLPISQNMVAGDDQTIPSYIGQEVVRGISADRWHVCAYQDWNKLTVSAEIYYNTLDVRMPGSENRVPLLIKSFEKKDNTNEVTERRIDFSYFNTKVDINSKALEIPFNMYCENAVTANPDMPKMSDEVYYESIFKNFGDTTQLRKPITKTYYLEDTYDSMYNIVSELKDSVGTNEITKVRKRMVHDYTAGLQYTTNLYTGQCAVSVINHPISDYHKKVGLVLMDTKRQFFKMDDTYNYEYMGTHKHFDRDIEADVYTAVKGEGDKKTILTWWFASKAFLKKIKFPFQALPLRFRFQNVNPSHIEEQELFHYTENPRQDQIFPDLSPCFSPGKEIYIGITLAGRYDRIYSRNPENFKAAFGTAMMDYSDLITPLRIAQLRVEPADKSNTLVQFTLLDKPSMVGNAVSMLPEKDNSQVWATLKKNLDSGQFTLTVHNDKGKHIVKAIKYSKEFDNPESFKVKQQVQLSSANLYSPGAMAGLGIGMLLVGLILGFGSLKVTKRYKDRVPDMDMQNLGK